MPVNDPYRKNTDGTPSEFSEALERQGYKSKKTIIVVVTTMVAVMSLLVNIFLLEEKSNKNIAKIEDYKSETLRLSKVVDENRIVIRSLNEQFEKNTKENNVLKSNLDQKKEELVATIKKIEMANEHIKNLEVQLEEKEKEIENYKNAIETSFSATMLIRKILGTINSYGYRLKRNELEKALLKKYITLFSEEDKKKIQILYEEFETIDIDQNGNLNSEEVALSVFK